MLSLLAQQENLSDILKPIYSVLSVSAETLHMRTVQHNGFELLEI